MKKIFAIALAMVMVLSMASAFALSDCAVWAPSWNCTVDNSVWCGQGKVEVVPYVKVNTACGWEYQVSDCAALVRSTEVYFAIKVTAEAYPDADWWHVAELKVESENLFVEGANAEWSYEVDTLISDFDCKDAFDGDADKEKVYYVDPDGALVDSEAIGFSINSVMFTAVAASENLACGAAPKYDVCATLSSYFNGYDAAVPGYNFDKVGDYTYEFTGASFTTETAADNEALEDGTLKITDKDGNYIEILVKKGAIKEINWENATAAAYNAMMADFNFAACGTAACITEKNILANFGWDDAQEDCFPWSTNAQAVVDTDCVVSIPKTGDVSVVAYAVMAVAAAAGMLKK